MIDRTHELSTVRQAKVLGISRGSVCSVYSLPRPTSETDLALMRRIDELPPTTPSPAVACCRGC